jgi:hypothetical protein
MQIIIIKMRSHFYRTEIKKKKHDVERGRQLSPWFSSFIISGMTQNHGEI